MKSWRARGWKYGIGAKLEQYRGWGARMAEE